MRAFAPVLPPVFQAGRRREKVFGAGKAIPLDGNAKARIWAFAQGYTARLRREGQHRGPLTRGYLDVLRALLWVFHNARSGWCFPSYERIASAARVSRATVARAVAALEAGGILTWENRLVRQRVAQPGLLGPVVAFVPRRTSNAYRLFDPQPALPGGTSNAAGERPKSQSGTGTHNQEVSALREPRTVADLDPSNALDAVLIRLGQAVGAIPAAGTV